MTSLDLQKKNLLSETKIDALVTSPQTSLSQLKSLYNIIYHIILYNYSIIFHIIFCLYK